jgi:FMN-dependent oxidoreductase (nitrilotriacetate monooxygenase family)
MKRIMLNSLKMATVGHSAVGMWRHPENQAFRYKDLDYWTETARQLEDAWFDGLFIADSLGLFDSYGSDAIGLRHAIHTPISDPLMLISAMAAVTRHIGFAVTVSTTYEQPYLLARKLTTLDHLTKGRVGWNVVTSALDSAARNLGYDQQMEHTARYEKADEFMEVVYKLWQGSWEDDAIVNNARENKFIEPAKVHSIGHQGRFFKVPDAFLCEPSVQRTPVIFQAGASAEGKRFAARHAEGIFVVETDPLQLRKLTSEIRRYAEEEGRDPQSIKFFAGATMVVGDTDADAARRYDEFQRYLSEDGMLARFSTMLQTDLSKVDIDKPLQNFETQGMRSVLERHVTGDEDRKLTVRQIAKKLASSPGGVCFTGSAATVADRMEEWMEQADIDGFNVGDYMPLKTIPELGASLVPELQRRGRVRTSYEGTTFRENLYGAGQKRPRSDHPAVQFDVKSKAA